MAYGTINVPLSFVGYPLIAERHRHIRERVDARLKLAALRSPEVRI